MTPYKEPAYKGTSFNCPICGAFAQQRWHTSLGGQGNGTGSWHVELVPGHTEFANCSHCSRQSIWINGLMVYPIMSIAPMPNSDMPGNVLSDYEEARSILQNSPRGAAALLRLGIQKLCIHLGERGENINADIASLVKKGLPDKLQKALDTVRVIGNNAVHPGQIDLTDDVELAYKLFGFMNVIVEMMITQPKQIDEVYNSTLPAGIKEAIARRDAK